MSFVVGARLLQTGTAIGKGTGISTFTATGTDKWYCCMSFVFGAISYPLVLRRSGVA